MYRPITSALSALLILGTAPAFAADLGVSQEPVAPAVAPAPTYTLGIEISPEFFAQDNGSNLSSALADTYYKLSLSHVLWGALSANVSFQDTIKPSNKYQYYAEAGLTYKFKLTDSLSLTPGIAIGETWNKTGILENGVGNLNATYYSATLAGDWKLNSQWTWNVFNARWRDSFNHTWETPKIATGFTFNIDAYDAVYANVGYSWKKLDTAALPYTDLSEDKYNIALGYKRSF